MQPYTVWLESIKMMGLVTNIFLLSFGIQSLVKMLVHLIQSTHSVHMHQPMQSSDCRLPYLVHPIAQNFSYCHITSWSD